MTNNSYPFWGQKTAEQHSSALKRPFARWALRRVSQPTAQRERCQPPLCRDHQSRLDRLVTEQLPLSTRRIPIAVENAFKRPKVE